MFKLVGLNAVLAGIHETMAETWREHSRLPDNLPALVEHSAAQLPADARTRLEDEIALTRTRALDTHPSAADRVRQAQALMEPGSEDFSERPAHELFAAFEPLCRQVTLAHYRGDLGLVLAADSLVSLEQMADLENQRRAGIIHVTPVPRIGGILP